MYVFIPAFGVSRPLRIVSVRKLFSFFMLHCIADARKTHYRTLLHYCQNTAVYEKIPVCQPNLYYIQTKSIK